MSAAFLLTSHVENLQITCFIRELQLHKMLSYKFKELLFIFCLLGMCVYIPPPTFEMKSFPLIYFLAKADRHS